MSEDIFTTEAHKCNYYQTHEENNDLGDVFFHPKNLCAVSHFSIAKSDMFQHDRFEETDTVIKFTIRTSSAVTRIYATHVDRQINLFNNGNVSVHPMMPGDYTKFNKKTNQIEVQQQYPSIAIAWKEGIFIFTDKMLDERCHELEKWHNVEIIINNKSPAIYKYTSVIKRTTTVNMVKKMVSLTIQSNYKN